MSRKTIIWRVVLGIVIVAALAAAGYGVYLWGYRNGAVATCMAEGDFPRALGRFGFFRGGDDDFAKPFGGYHGLMPHDDDDMPMPFHQRMYYPNQYPMARAFFSPLSWVLWFVGFGLLIWLIYTVIGVLTRGKGWQLSFRSIEDGDEKGKKK